MINNLSKLETKNEIIYGYKKVPPWLHLKYRQAVNFKCQRCKKHEDEVGKLIPHRITRKTHGGLYTIFPLNHPQNNIKVCCLGCHKLFHANDNRKVRCN